MILALLLACSEGALEPGGGERFALLTDDGATVVLHRYAPEGEARGMPVLIVHGISSNSRCWDLDEQRSLGRFLAENGHDAWLLDLRGHGEALNDAQGRRQWVGWSMDDYGLHDIPAAIDFIREKTGAAGIAYVGHSLGGMVGAITSARAPAGQHIAAMVVVGSPMDFSDPDPVIRGALKLAEYTLVPVVPSDAAGDLRALFGPGRTPVEKMVDTMLFNDIDPEKRAEMYRAVSSPMTRDELRQLGKAVPAQAFADATGTIDYVEALGAVHTPTLVIAGRADLIAPVDRVWAWYEAVGAEQKKFVIAGRSTGFAADYGHLDLPIGDHAREEIYPLILDWVER